MSYKPFRYPDNRRKIKTSAKPAAKTAIKKSLYATVFLNRDKENPYDMVVIEKKEGIDLIREIRENRQCSICANGILLFDTVVTNRFTYKRFQDIVIINGKPQPFSNSFVDPAHIPEEAKQKLKTFYKRQPLIFNHACLPDVVKKQILSGHGLD